MLPELGEEEIAVRVESGECRKQGRRFLGEAGSFMSHLAPLPFSVPVRDSETGVSKRSHSPSLWSGSWGSSTMASCSLNSGLSLAAR